MSPHRRASGLVLAAALALGAGVAAEPEAGLIEAPGWKLVYAHCSGCHGLDLVTAQRGDRIFWTAAIRRMQANENLWRFDPHTEDQLLTYLSRQYGVPPFAGRRAPLAPSLQPGATPRED
ncbi:MAG: hypothetical protein F4149_10540 [Gammaproteobacteria bacterium]|nr:hypothetical protein [Gammaproteobacteria bacterium]